MKLLDLYNQCVRANYIHLDDNSADYSYKIVNSTLYIYLQWSDGREDWRNNFDFPAKPYKDMPFFWKAHRGFVRVWKTIEPQVKELIENPKIDKIIIAGYSHGAALACLAHEYAWYKRVDIRNNIYTFAFEAPRVFCGLRIPKELKQRWENFYVIRNGSDIVTHLPPYLFGFKHVGNLIKVKTPKKDYKPLKWGKKQQFKFPKFISYHDFDNVRSALRDYDNTHENII